MSHDSLQSFTLIGRILWEVPFDGPNEVSLAPYQDGALLTPLGQFRAGLIHMENMPPGTCLLVEDTRLWMSLERLTLRVNSATKIADAWAVARRLLKDLRHVAGQATFPQRIVSGSRRDASDYGGPLPEFGPHVSDMVQFDIARGKRVTVAAIERLANLASEHEWPDYDAIMLDAHGALHEREYSRAILYSAIAMESGALHALETRYDALLAGRLPSHRVVDLPTKDGITTKDPIYESLARSRDFRTCLHERALYVLGRSLLVDNKTLYDEADALYTARNGLAHGKPRKALEKDFGPTGVAAERALRIAGSVLDWFGCAGNFELGREEEAVNYRAPVAHAVYYGLAEPEHDHDPEVPDFAVLE